MKNQDTARITSAAEAREMFGAGTWLADMSAAIIEGRAGPGIPPGQIATADDVTSERSNSPINREQLRRDLEWFSYLAPALGRNALHETPLDVVLCADLAIGDYVTTTIMDGGRWLDDGSRLQIQRKHRRARIRASARARKHRRG